MRMKRHIALQAMKHSHVPSLSIYHWTGEHLCLCWGQFANKSTQSTFLLKTDQNS